MSDVQRSNHAPATIEVLALLRERGGSQYGGESVSQLEHALQAAHFAEQSGAGAPLIAAALLHDVGHLLHSLPDNAPDRGVDDRHEALAAQWLKARFPREVIEPVRLHVAAKRYLCATDRDYTAQLSPPSALSLKLQGGPMTTEEARQFAAHRSCEAAVAVRRWDDAAKVPEMKTPPLEHFAAALDACALERS